MPRNVPIQVRRGTAAQWSSANPTLLAGEPAIETDTGILKIGDGSTVYNSLTSNISTLTKTTRSATLVIAAADSSAKSKAQADYVCDGTADQTEINAAITALPSTGGRVLLLDGNYYISNKIVGKAYSDILGLGYGTIINVAGIGTNDVITTGDYSSFGYVKIYGDVSTLPTDFTQRIIPGSYNYISNVWVSNTGYGVECGAQTNVTLEHMIFDNIKCASDWGASLHVHDAGKYIHLNDFSIVSCNRGIECEDGAEWVIAENGYMKSIQNFNSTGAEPFAMDAHTHGNTGVKHIRYRNIYAESTYSPQSRQTGGTGVNEDIIIENIQLVSPTASMILTGKNITARNVTGTAYTSVSNAESVLLEGIGGTQNSGMPQMLIGDNVINAIVSRCDINAAATTPSYGIQVNGANSKNICIKNNKFNSSTFTACVRITNVGGLVEVESNYSATAPFISGSTTNLKFKNNIGYISEKTGTATITTGQTTVAVSHGLAAAPTRVILSPTTATAGKDYYVSAKAASTFTITIDSTADAEISFDWQAVV